MRMWLAKWSGKETSVFRKRAAFEGGQDIMLLRI
jgi:hypothetical protein